MFTLKAVCIWRTAVKRQNLSRINLINGSSNNWMMWESAGGKEVNMLIIIVFQNHSLIWKVVNLPWIITTTQGKTCITCVVNNAREMNEIIYIYILACICYAPPVQTLTAKMSKRGPKTTGGDEKKVMWTWGFSRYQVLSVGLIWEVNSSRSTLKSRS